MILNKNEIMNAIKMKAKNLKMKKLVVAMAS